MAALTPPLPTAVPVHELICVDASRETPVFQQIHSSIVAALDSNRIAAGQKLPTVRALAEALSLAPNTVAKAYRSLEADGVIEGRGRAGTFVRLTADPLQAAAQAVALSAAAGFTRLGVAPADAQKLLHAAFQATAAQHEAHTD